MTKSEISNSRPLTWIKTSVFWLKRIFTENHLTWFNWLCIINGLEKVRMLHYCTVPLQWRHNESYCVSNHRRLDGMLNRLFRRRSKKTSKPALLTVCGGIHRSPLDSPHKRPVTRETFPFDDVIMLYQLVFCTITNMELTSSLVILVRSTST